MAKNTIHPRLKNLFPTKSSQSVVPEWIKKTQAAESDHTLPRSGPPGLEPMKGTKRPQVGLNRPAKKFSTMTPDRIRAVCNKPYEVPGPEPARVMNTKTPTLENDLRSKTFGGIFIGHQSSNKLHVRTKVVIFRGWPLFWPARTYCLDRAPMVSEAQPAIATIDVEPAGPGIWHKRTYIIKVFECF